LPACTLVAAAGAALRAIAVECTPRSRAAAAGLRPPATGEIECSAELPGTVEEAPCVALDDARIPTLRELRAAPSENPPAGPGTIHNAGT